MKKTDADLQREFECADRFRRVMLSALEDEKRAREDAAEKEERLRFALESMGVGEWSLDLVTHAAERSLLHDRIFGYETLLPTWTYEMFLEHIIPEDREMADRKVEDAIARGTNSDVECRIIRRDGELRWIRACGRHYHRPSGHPIMVGTVEDITERKMAEEELRAAKQSLEDFSKKLELRVQQRTEELFQSYKEMEAFSYSVSHDLRAPVRSMTGFSEALLEDCYGVLDEKGRDYLQRIYNAGKEMDALIDDILDLARVTRSALDLEEVDLSAAAAKIVEELGREDPSRAVEVVIQPGIVVSADKQLAVSLMRNLLDNAWKFTSRNPAARIEFGSYPSEGETICFVKDNGVGFDMAHAGKLFGAFQRLHAKEEFSGSGIGLATVDRIVKRHGGRVWAESRLGEGAMFSFTLRRSVGDGSRRRAEEERP